jgi:biopolymer transport protein ExbD
MDMFTIILIFLLFSFSENPETITLGKDMELPESSSKTDYNEAVKIVLSKNEIRLNEEWIGSIEKTKIAGMESSELESSALYQRLKTYRSEFERNKTAKGQAPHIFLICDKSHSFKTVNSIIKTAGLAGYPNFQFAVLESGREADEK